MNLWRASDRRGRWFCVFYLISGFLFGPLYLLIGLGTWWVSVFCWVVWWACAYANLRSGRTRAETQRINDDIDRMWRENGWLN